MNQHVIDSLNVCCVDRESPIHVHHLSTTVTLFVEVIGHLCQERVE